MKSLAALFVPTAPLVPWVLRSDLRDDDENLYRSWLRASNRGRMTMALADRVALAVGVLPELVYGDEWWQE